MGHFGSLAAAALRVLGFVCTALNGVKQSADLHERSRRSPINTNDRLLLELVASETDRAGKAHVSVRFIAWWLNLDKNTAQRRVTAMRDQALIERVAPGGMHSSASYRITADGLAALQQLQVPTTWFNAVQDHAVDTERTGTWYRSVPVPDAMRRLRGPWELWRSLPHGTWFTAEDVLPHITATTVRTVRNWTKELVHLEIPLAEWKESGSQFRLLAADRGVFDQLRLVQEQQLAQQGRSLRSRADLDRSYQVERTLADEKLEKWGRQP